VVAEINLKEFDNRSIVLNSYKVNSSWSADDNGVMNLWHIYAPSM
jgi:hypothetical protein